MMIKNEHGKIVYDDQDVFNFEQVKILPYSDLEQPVQTEEDAAFKAIALREEAARLRAYRNDARSEDAARRAELLQWSLFKIVRRDLLNHADAKR